MYTTGLHTPRTCPHCLRRVVPRPPTYPKHTHTPAASSALELAPPPALRALDRGATSALLPDAWQDEVKLFPTLSRVELPPTPGAAALAPDAYAVGAAVYASGIETDSPAATTAWIGIRAAGASLRRISARCTAPAPEPSPC